MICIKAGVETKIGKLILSFIRKFVNFVLNFLDLTIYQFCKFNILDSAIVIMKPNCRDWLLKIILVLR